MITNFNKFKSYFGDNVSYLWIKNTLPKYNKNEKIRKQILSERRKELNISEFQPLYDYWSFCKYFNDEFTLGNNLSLDAISERIIPDYVNYLVMLQLYSDDMKNAKIYENPYNELLSLPRLSGDLNTDKNILSNLIKDVFYNPSSSIRQCIMLLDTRIKNKWY